MLGLYNKSLFHKPDFLTDYIGSPNERLTVMSYRIVFDVIWFAECRSTGDCTTAATLELLLNKVNLK